MAKMAEWAGKEHFQWIKANVTLTPGDLQKIEEN